MPDHPDIKFRSDVSVDLVKANASDSDVVWAARVSTAGEASLEARDEDPERNAGLIRYLMRDRHGTPFEHNSMTFLISAPIFVFREFMRHRVGWCVAGDTLITTESIGARSGRTIRKVRIDGLYDRWHNGVLDSMGRTRHLPSIRLQQVRVLNENTLLFERAPIVDVVRSGVKEVMTLRTATGQLLRCTSDHALFTNEGWVKAGDLDPDHLLTVNGKRSLNPTRQDPPALRAGIGVWTSMQRNTVIKPVDRCYLCDGVFSRDDLVVDHIVPVVQDLARSLDVTNLAPACLPCHRTKTSSEQVLARRGCTSGAKFVPYERLDGLDEVMTYDLSVGGDWHNFVANGLVVHNSYNEESGRYRQLEPVFYVPGTDRKLVQEGKPGRYLFVDGTSEQHKLVVEATEGACRQAYGAYLEMLDAGIAREVARGVLPVSTYSSMYATCNARSLMSFLGLRTKHEDARFPSFPQREIEMVAEGMEEHFKVLMPIVHAAYQANGRVAP